MNIFESMWRKLSQKGYREQYALSFLKRSVAFQIKTLRKKHCGSQAVLAERSHLTQGVVSRAEDQEYGNLTFNTVGRIAAGLDMAFIGRFVPWSELASFAEDLSEREFTRIPLFEEEDRNLNAWTNQAQLGGKSSVDRNPNQFMSGERKGPHGTYEAQSPKPEINNLGTQNTRSGGIR